MVEFLIAGLVSCTQIEELVDRIETNRIYSIDQKQELIHIVRESSPECYPVNELNEGSELS